MTTVKHRCAHCGCLLESVGPSVGIDMDEAALAGIGRAIIEARLLHCILDCPALTDDPPAAPPLTTCPACDHTHRQGERCGFLSVARVGVPAICVCCGTGPPPPQCTACSHRHHAGTACRQPATMDGVTTADGQSVTVTFCSCLGNGPLRYCSDADFTVPPPTKSTPQPPAPPRT